MKKVSILSLHLGYGGIEKSIVALANVLCEKYDVEIACCYKLYDKPAFLLDNRIKVKYLLGDMIPNRSEFNDALSKKKIFSIISEGIKSIKILHYRKKNMVRYIKNSSADIIISSRDIFDEWLSEYGSSNAIKIGWEHNHYHDDLSYAYRIVKSCKRLDYLVLVSKELQRFYSKKLINSKCKCVYIPNIIDYIPSRCASLKEKRLVSVGRLSSEKGYMDLLKIFYILSKKHSDWKLDIIGDGAERDNLQEFINNYKLNDVVVLHGFRDKDYINNIFKKSSIYTMTSYTESFGIVLIEAMSFGLPCIAFSSAEGARELISSGKNGYLIKNRSYKAYIKKVEDLMNDIDKRKQIGKAGRESIKKYTSSVVGDIWFKLLEKK